MKHTVSNRRWFDMLLMASVYSSAVSRVKREQSDTHNLVVI